METTFLPLETIDNSFFSPNASEKNQYIATDINNETNSSFKKRLIKLYKTTSGKIILGGMVLISVGIITIPAILLSKRNKTSAISNTAKNFLQPSLTLQSIPTIAAYTKMPTPTFRSIITHETPTKMVIQSYTRLTINPSTRLITQPSSQATTKVAIQVTTKPQANLTTTQSLRYNYTTDFIMETANNIIFEVNIQNMQRNLKNLLSLGLRDNEHDSENSNYKEAIKFLDRILKTLGIKTYRQDFFYGDDAPDYRHRYQYDLASIVKSKESERCNPRNNNSCNLCALIPGKSNNFIVVGAHLDTFPGTPGANDNASSVVALLEIIRIFKESKLQLNHPILFCFWGSEEIATPINRDGLGFGSGFFLHKDAYKNITKALTKNNNYQKQKDDIRIQYYLNLELIGTKRKRYAEDIFFEDPNSTPEIPHYDIPDGTQNLTNLYEEFLINKNISFSKESVNPEETDVYSFYDKNIPAITITASIDAEPSCYHKSCDNYTEINFETVSKITKTVLYSLTKLSL